ncbi:UPF0158 family protein [Vineibacter terrae]|uniref:UPF0158 family protein n=1 Tax=Vineibacter terrae TaxID=2586908 RepID=UPI002E343772|nr:UPF0158 family protein [Vineibacter terrae]HEX2885606.1 UPF0158 family protein [Vineibacter terrae]
MPVKFDDILEAYEFVSFGGRNGQEAYLCRRTGTIHLYGDDGELDALPDDIDDDTRYVRIPDKDDLHLGLPLVMAFVEQFMPDDYHAVMDIFRKKNAYRRLRWLLTGRKRLEQWQAFEAKAAESALREWCKDSGIEIEG